MIAHRWIPLKWPGRESDYGVHVVGADFDGQFQYSEGFCRLAELQQTAAEIAERPQTSRFQTQSPAGAGLRPCDTAQLAQTRLPEPPGRECGEHPANALTTKNLGDAAEHDALSQFAIAGMPGAKMLDNWKGYDLAVETVRRKLGNAAGVFADLVTVRVGGSAMSGALSGIVQAVRRGGLGLESSPDGSRRTAKSRCHWVRGEGAGFGPRKTRKDAELRDRGTVSLEAGVADAIWGWLWLKSDRVFEPRKTRNTRN
jgi:hypothetical protein